MASYTVLKSLDLFSGIGGLTHALRGFAEPVAYCEWDADCLDVLEARIQSGDLPNAVMYDDVNFLSAEKHLCDKKVDIIVAGFPCIGFSNLGKRKGLENEQSGLFFHVMRLADELQPDYLFLENVPAILSNGLHEVATEITKRGYDMRWHVCHAGTIDPGAPQERKRWFCLCSKRGVEPKTLHVKRGMKPYIYGDEPVPRMILDWDAKKDAARLKQLGNTVIPDAARAAFAMLWSGTREPYTAAYAPGPRDFLPFAKYPMIEGEILGETSWPSSGCATAGRKKGEIFVNACPPPKIPPLKDWGLVLDSKTFDGSVKNKKVHTSSLVTKPVRRARWSTPRTNGGGVCRVLTERSGRDLGTMLRFERNTPDYLRGGRVNPQFCEWLMGFEIDWTKTVGQ